MQVRYTRIQQHKNKKIRIIEQLQMSILQDICDVYKIKRVKVYFSQVETKTEIEKGIISSFITNYIV